MTPVSEGLDARGGVGSTDVELGEMDEVRGTGAEDWVLNVDDVVASWAFITLPC